MADIQEYLHAARQLQLIAPAGIPVLVGPTGSGKTAIAENMLDQYNCRLINVDPFQSYQHAAIGTAQPDPQLWELVDILPHTETINAASMAAKVWAQVAMAVSANQIPILVSGSGFYLQALRQPLDPEPQISRDERERIQTRVAMAPQQISNEIIAANGPTIAINDHYRLEKAYIRWCTAPDSEGSSQITFPPLRLAFFGLWASGPSYERHLHNRITTMIAAGWVTEVENLSNSVSSEATIWKALGYSYIRQNLPNPTAIDIQQLVIESRQLAKKQRTWFRRWPVRWAPWTQPTIIRNRLLQYCATFWPANR